MADRPSHCSCYCPEALDCDYYNPGEACEFHRPVVKYCARCKHQLILKEGKEVCPIDCMKSIFIPRSK